MILGFNVRADASARSAVKETGVEIRYYNIIYDLENRKPNPMRIKKQRWKRT